MRIGFLVLACVLFLHLLPAGEEKNDTHLRRPIALTLIEDGKTLLIANRDSGTVSVWDVNKRNRLSESRVGRKLSDMTATPNGNLILVTDAEAGDCSDRSSWILFLSSFRLLFRSVAWCQAVCNWPM